MDAAPESLSIQAAVFARRFDDLVQYRGRRAPVVLALYSLLALLDPTPLRVAVLVSLGVVSMVWWRIDLRLPHRPGIVRNVVGMSVLQLSIVAATGGLGSPILVALIPLAIMMVLALGRRPWPIPGVQLLGVTLFFVAERLGWWSPTPGSLLDGLTTRHTPATATATWLAVCIVLLGGSQVAVLTRRQFEQLLSMTAAAREDVLDAHAAQARELTALSAEIAHELKNPLASVKGLASLLVRDLPEGKSAQRAAVLRGEADRMQGILDEFLNFSRPLVPLALERVDLADLAAEVAALHEGVGRDNAVSIETSGVGEARGDRRKLTQILVNLVQNAVQSGGRRVWLRIEDVAAHAHVHVDDDGPGPPEELAVFEPGVTTRAGGSGLGLTISRAIARQHGGDVVLVARPGGGCRATLTLPHGGPS